MHKRIRSHGASLVVVISQVLRVGSHIVRTGNLRKIWTTTDFPKREEIRRKRRFAKTFVTQASNGGPALSSSGDLSLVRPTDLPTCGLGGVCSQLVKRMSHESGGKDRNLLASAGFSAG